MIICIIFFYVWIIGNIMFLIFVFGGDYDRNICILMYIFLKLVGMLYMNNLNLFRWL